MRSPPKQLCPYCANEMDTQNFFKNYRYENYKIPIDQGMRCPSCSRVAAVSHHKLMVRTLLINIGIFLFTITFITIPVVLFPYWPSTGVEFFYIFCGVVFGLVFSNKFVHVNDHKYLILMIAEDESKLKNDDGMIEAQEVYEEELLYGYMDNHANKYDWECQHCGAENPKELHLCWNCEREK